MLEDTYEPQNAPLYEAAENFLTYIKLGIASVVLFGAALAFVLYWVLG